MKALVFGKTGQVAIALAQTLPNGVTAEFLDREQADLTRPDTCASAILSRKPDVVINAAAYTAVDKAEEEEATATLINGDSPGAMAQAAAQLGIPILHISTDYVFDGSGTAAFAPDDPTNPLGAYGRSKLRGEALVQAAGGQHLILRTSWVFSAHGNNFVKTMLRLGRDRASLSVVDDQIGGPTPASAIASTLWTAAKAMRAGHPGGTFHLSGAPDVSWAGFASAIMNNANLPCVITPIPSSAYPTPAKRPTNSRLNCDSLHTAFGITRPDWRDALRHVLSELETSS